MSDTRIEETMGDCVVRLEITMSQAIEEDFVTKFMAEDTGKKFTKLPVVMGRGNTEPKMGDAVWPQVNCMYIVFCTEDQSQHVVDIVLELRSVYPNEGIACFKSSAESY